jgi:leucyl aminopeptidase
MQVQVFDKARLAKMKAGALLSVAQGSQTPPYLIKMTYKPTGRTKRKVISLVGKGVTFDSGGLSIKSGAGMMDMKCDMSGAATVIAAMQAIAAVKPSCEVRAYIPATENMINGRATRPGDVVKASNGKSIEILNTDAEGRLILADALCLAEKDGCDQIIDLATLTGACLVALGKDYAGLYSTSEKMVKGLSEAAAHAGERVWHMPLADEYRSLIKSSVADIKNIGGPHGGSITAALFLQEFVENTDWAHLDIAGPAFTASASDYISKGGVGFGVGTLVRYVQSI